MYDCLVAFGSNVGDGSAVFGEVIQRLSCHPAIKMLTVSDLIRTRPVGNDGQDFLNGCLRFQTEYPTGQIFNLLAAIEKQLGRQRRRRWGDRIVDLDLLLVGDFQCRGEDLVVPHPRMSFRRFVLHAARQIAADMIHPTSGLTVSQLIDRLDSTPDRIVLASATGPGFETTERRLGEICAANQWDFKCVYEPRSLEQLIDDIKLLVFARGIEKQLYERASRFPGPGLELGELDPEIAEIEISAAIQSMSCL